MLRIVRNHLWTQAQQCKRLKCWCHVLIITCEKELGEIPSDLREFWTNVGYGFIRSANHNTNRILDPISVIDFRLGQGDFEILPDIEIYKEYQDNKLVFFEGNESAYLSIGISGEISGKVFYYDVEVASSLEVFLEKILSNDTYYVDLFD